MGAALRTLGSRSQRAETKRGRHCFPNTTVPPNSHFYAENFGLLGWGRVKREKGSQLRVERERLGSNLEISCVSHSFLAGNRCGPRWEGGVALKGEDEDVGKL